MIIAGRTNFDKFGRIQGFAYRAPEAVSVQLMGDFTEWEAEPIHLTRGPGGVWRITLELPPGLHHYRFLVDGQWRDDPDCKTRVPNAFGGHDMTRKVN